MRVLITHIPHYALGLGLVVLYVLMERAEKRNQRLAGPDGEVPDHLAGGPRAHQALAFMLFIGLATSVGAMMWHSSRNELPGWSQVLTYLGVGILAAIWVAWNVPSRLPASVSRRMGVVGRSLVRGAVMLVIAWGVFFAGMYLAQGVVLPGTPH